MPGATDAMRLREKGPQTYRTFPQRVVQSSGLSDRWPFLKWCCPFCLEGPPKRTPSSNLTASQQEQQQVLGASDSRRSSTTSSSIPAIRVTRVPTRESYSETDDDEALILKNRTPKGASSSSSSIAITSVGRETGREGASSPSGRRFPDSLDSCESLSAKSMECLFPSDDGSSGKSHKGDRKAGKDKPRPSVRSFLRERKGRRRSSSAVPPGSSSKKEEVNGVRPARSTEQLTSSGHHLFAKVKRKRRDESTGGSIEEMGGGGSPERGSGSSLVGGMSVGGSHTLGHVPMSKNVSPMPPEGGGTLGPKSSRGSIASLASSETSQADDDVERLVLLHENKRSGLTPLGSPSESMASVCSTGAEGRYGTVAVRGEIEVGLQYNYKEGQLEVLVMQCRDLAAVDAKRNRSDPYVKVYLLPDKSKSGKRKTKVKKHTLNPVFEEVLKFHSTMSELETRTLWVSVWHSDMFGRNDFLGEIILPFSDQVFDDNTPKWHPLQDRTEPLDDLTYNSPRGDLILALKFVPPDPVGSSRKNRRSRGALHVLIKEAKSLAPIKPNGSADPVCKGLLLPEKGKSSKQKTSVCRKTLNPAWNHTLIFQDVSLQDLTERSLEISVWDHDRLGGSQYLGGARLNLGKGKHNGRHVEWMDAAGMEMRLWEQMLDRPNLWVEGSIMLRPSMDKPIYSSSVTE